MGQTTDPCGTPNGTVRQWATDVGDELNNYVNISTKNNSHAGNHYFQKGPLKCSVTFSLYFLPVSRQGVDAGREQCHPGWIPTL